MFSNVCPLPSPCQSKLVRLVIDIVYTFVPGRFKYQFSQSMIVNPDYILENVPNTCLLLKRIEDKTLRTQVVLRLHTSNDPSEFKNSIISAWEISETRWNNYVRNKNILYKRE